MRLLNCANIGFYFDKTANKGGFTNVLSISDSLSLSQNYMSEYGWLLI